MSLLDGGYRQQRQRLRLIFIIFFYSSFLAKISLGQFRLQTRLPDNEVEALQEIGNTLKKTDWDFSVDPCSGNSGWVDPKPEKGFEKAVACNCTFMNNTVCHITEIVLKSQNLPGVLPPELVKLPYLQALDLSRNYLNGTIPKEWGSLQLRNLSLLTNRLSGPIPKEIGNITSLVELVLENNQLSGVLPPELGKLVNLQRMAISSNNFTGGLPDLSGLTNLKNFWISDNRFTGKLPTYIEKWTKLVKLTIHASGLEGPIPSGIFTLEKLKDLRISDLHGTGATTLPPLSNMTNMKSMKILILRNCNITGTLPTYLGEMDLKHLDLSFNKLTGEIPSSFSELILKAYFLYLTGNMLSGRVPDWMLNRGVSIDLSYNNFTLVRSGTPSCQQQNVNLFGSSSLGNTSTGIVPCLKSFQCPRTWYSFHINCGGKEVNINENTTYDEDNIERSDSARFYQSKDNWALSSTGTFMDNDNDNDFYIVTNNSRLSMDNSQLYTTARLSPLSLTYYGFCLLNENYYVSLHFAEIMFPNDNTFNSLGRRTFDVYIQGQMVLQDFNIVEEAGGVGKEVIKTFPAVVTSNTLEIRFNWAGKGTTGIPVRGTYGPLVSAISVNPNFVPPSEDVASSKDGKKISAGVVVGIVVSVLCLIFMVLGILWWNGCLRTKNEIDADRRFNRFSE